MSRMPAIKYVTDQGTIDEIHELDTLIFNDGSILVEDLPGKLHYWCMRDQCKIIAYGVVEECGNGIIKGQRTGVVKQWRGRGIQKRFIRKRHSFFGNDRTHVTYIHPHNVASINSFLKLGYRAYKPKKLYGGTDKLYLKKEMHER